MSYNTNRNFLNVLVLTAIITLFIHIFLKKGQNITTWILRLRWIGIWTATLAVNFFMIVVVSQKICYTPPIIDGNNNVLEDSISEITKVDINGSKEWITVRGNSKDKPILLFLAGGPGGSELAKKLPKENGDLDVLEKLNKQDPPPYHGSDVTWKSATYLMYLSKQMSKNPEISNPGYNTIAEACAPEYGFYDTVNYFRGIVSTFNTVYQQLYDRLVLCIMIAVNWG